MRDDLERRWNTLNRIVGFAKSHPEDFPEGSRATMLAETIRISAEAAKTADTEKTSSSGAKVGATMTKADYFEEIVDDLREISRTAKAIAIEEPAVIGGKFRMPRDFSHGSILTAARAFLKDAGPIAAKFIEYELPVDFLEDLTEDIAGFEAAAEDQGIGLTEQVGGTKSVAESITTGFTAVRKLVPLLRNKYRRNAERLAEWISASHVERAPRPKPEETGTAG